MKTKSFILFLLGFSLFVNGINAQVVKGKVVDSKTNEPVIGASVSFQNTNGANGLATDNQGEFTVDRRKSGDVLKISYLGYKSKEIKLAEKSKNLTIKLEEDQRALDEVVVIGYGKSSKEKLTGSVSTITSEVLSQYPGTNLLEVLQGRVAGLTIARSSGLPGAKASINIRGINTLNPGSVDADHVCCGSGEESTNTEPLIIIDGVPFINQTVSPLELGAVGAIGPLSTLSTSDIERIDVLKDADATAIYGSRGANGVILITTKKQ